MDFPYTPHLFLLTRPSRDVTQSLQLPRPGITISTHTSLAGRDWLPKFDDAGAVISTHTSLAGRDGGAADMIQVNSNFYSHVPRGT